MPATCKAYNECSVSFSGVKCKLRCPADICPMALGCTLRRNTCPVFHNQQSSGWQAEQDRAGRGAEEQRVRKSGNKVKNVGGLLHSRFLR